MSLSAKESIPRDFAEAMALDQALVSKVLRQLWPRNYVCVWVGGLHGAGVASLMQPPGEGCDIALKSVKQEGGCCAEVELLRWG